MFIVFFYIYCLHSLSHHVCVDIGVFVGVCCYVHICATLFIRWILFSLCEFLCLVFFFIAHILNRIYVFMKCYWFNLLSIRYFVAISM